MTDSMDKDSIFVDNKEMRFSLGMTVTAEVKAGKRRIIEYIWAAFVRHGSESLRER